MQRLTIGQALAYLSQESDSGMNPEIAELGEEAAEYLQSLRNRWHRLQSNRGTEALIAKIPQTACFTEKAFLHNNDDFFVGRLLICRDDDMEGEFCTRLIRHLNDCYPCFEEFCQVQRDYYQKCQELTHNLKG